MSILKMDPEIAYLGTDLFLPKMYVHMPSVENALSFWVESRDETDGGYFLRQYVEFEHHVMVPRYFIKPEDYDDLEYPVVDIRPPKRRAEFRSLIDPAEVRKRNQEDIQDAFRAASSGTLNLACGKGKTVMALDKVAQTQTPTVIVLNNTGILEQWDQEIRRFLDFDGEIGRIQGSSLQYGPQYPICLAMIQTLAQKTWPDDFCRWFGLAIFDEAHHVSAPVFSRAANLFYGDRFALTATPNRLDGNERIYQYHLGEIFYKDLTQDLVPMVYFLRTGTALPKGRDGKTLKSVLQQICPKRAKKVEANIHHGLLCQWLGAHSARNDLILQEVKRARDKGRQVLALSHSKDHVNLLHGLYPGSGLLTGDTKQRQILSQLHDNDVVFATVGKAREGLDKPSLDTLFLLTPFRNPNDYQQMTGRILRQRDRKNDPVIVLLEDDIGTSRGAAGEIRKLARKHKHKWEVLK